MHRHRFRSVASIDSGGDLMLSKDMERAEKRPDWVDLVPAEPTLLDRLVPRRSTLRRDRRPGNRAASASRSPFLIECQGTERSFNAPPHL
jgi:hypothetical protein